MSSNNAFDPHFPAAKEVQDLTSAIGAEQISSLSQLADLSVPVGGSTAKPAALDSAIEQVQATGSTINFWGDAFAGTRAGTLTREGLDQKLVNWVLGMPGMSSKVDELPPQAKAMVQEFRTADLSSPEWDGMKLAEKFRIPTSVGTQKKMEELKGAVDALDEEAMKKYPFVVEEDGSPVMYVDKAVFQNWGQTVKNTPAVPLSTLCLTVDHVYSQDGSRCAEYRQIRQRNGKESPLHGIQTFLE
jgi:hypothetical protein